MDIHNICMFIILTPQCTWCSLMNDNYANKDLTLGKKQQINKQ